ncbi:GTPase-activating protein GYP7-like isoform X2 [Tasmannia lanceolata]|uniref:GTPase-activating protein GYP7-like isoform X2 n=1 Tax=Tasmannia lanceolata TaxID=3420 RepID=UPI00406446B4
MWRDTGAPSDSFYAVRPECSDVPKTRFKIKAGKTLSARKWHAAFTQEGYLDISKTLSRIQRGGIHPSIRGEVWEFLLGCFAPKSTFDERDQLRQRRRDQYARWKEECREMDPIVGSGRIITAPIITEDGEPIPDPLALLQANPDKVLPIPPQARSAEDSLLPPSNESLENAFDDLRSNTPNGLEKVEYANHVPLDKKVIQWKLTLHQIGMSDLCSPMVVLLEDEADAFWCFERLMRRLRGNFRCTERSVGVESQLNSLASITQVLDPKLHQHLETLGGGHYLFAFRMLMVLFRRELSFGDSLFLWEMMWALEYDPDIFYLYEEPCLGSEKSEGSKGKVKSARQCGKYERENMRNGRKNPETNLPISVFLVSSVLKNKSSKILQEARGLDDVVKILNDINGNLDAKQACSSAIKLHKKYLKKAKKT